MIPAEMVLGFFSSAKSSNRKIKITGSDRGVKKGYIRDVKMENRVITLDLDGEIFAFDMNVYEAKTSFFDHRVLHVIGEENYKIQLG